MGDAPSMNRVTIDSLIEGLEEARKELGGDTEVLIPSYEDREVAAYPVAWPFFANEFTGIDSSGLVSSEVNVLIILPEDAPIGEEEEGEDWKRK
jgi:hypothetical protein